MLLKAKDGAHSLIDISGAHLQLQARAERL
jgi:hypothetical protein